MPSAALITKVLEALLKGASLLDRILTRNEVQEDAKRRQRVADAIQDDPVNRFNKEFGGRG
jgi:hypothetical protein